MNYSQIKLHYVLPRLPEIYSQNWSEEDKDYLKIRIKVADSVEIVSNGNDKNCIEKETPGLLSWAIYVFAILTEMIFPAARDRLSAWQKKQIK